MSDGIAISFILYWEVIIVRTIFYNFNRLNYFVQKTLGPSSRNLLFNLGSARIGFILVDPSSRNTNIRSVTLNRRSLAASISSPEHLSRDTASFKKICQHTLVRCWFSTVPLKPHICICSADYQSPFSLSHVRDFSRNARFSVTLVPTLGPFHIFPPTFCPSSRTYRAFGIPAAIKRTRLRIISFSRLDWN